MKNFYIETPIELVEGVAEASVGSNPTFRWCKFVLTDDKANLNKHRIPVEEFDNLIRTGIFAPIKMAYKDIKDGHEDSFPLGTITNLKKNGNIIEGLAALWTLEREDDVEKVKELHDSGKPLNLSWEVLYGNETPEEDGVVALRDCVLRATTLVGMPAYAGRTPILQVASLENSEENKLEKEELEQKLAELQTQLDALKADSESKDAKIAELTSSVESLTAEKDELANYKASIEEAKQAEEKLASIKNKFVESGIEKPESYFADNKERLLKMGEEDLAFLLQELVSFASIAKEGKASTKVTVPNLPSSTNEKVDPRELARKLREESK